MKDPATASLAIAALSDDDEMIQGGGLGALEALRNNAYTSEFLQYLDHHPDEATGDLLESLGKLGDPPGSTAVRDRLVGEANKQDE